MSFKKLLPAAVMVFIACTHDFNSVYDPQVNAVPQPSFNVTITGDSVFFDATGTQDDDNAQPELDARWDFDNDGNFELDWSGWLTRGQVHHLYTTPGTYTVVMEVKDPPGAVVRAINDVIVSSSGVPQAAFAISPSPVVQGSQVTFDATSTTDDNNLNLLEARWDFDNNGVWDMDWNSWDVRRIVNYTYSSNGIYTVVLEVRDQDSNSDIETKDITVNASSSPFAHFNLNPKYGTLTITQTSATITFDANTSRDEAGNTDLEYRWKFKNDMTDWDEAQLNNPVRSFTYQALDAGLQKVILQVRDKNSNNFATATVQFNIGATGVTAHDPTACFTATPARGFTSTEFTFDASGSTDPDAADVGNLEYCWCYGDGNGYTDWGTNPINKTTFSTVGARTIFLQVKDPAGQISLATLRVTVE